MHFNGVRSPDDELETTKHTTSYSHQWKSNWHADPSILFFAILWRIATSSKQRFWKLTLKNIPAWLGMARHLTCFECFDSTCWFLPVRRSLKSGQDWAKQKANRTNSKFISDYGRRDTSYISHFASKVQCNGQQFAGSEGSWHLNMFKNAQVWKNGTNSGSCGHRSETRAATWK